MKSVDFIKNNMLNLYGDNNLSDFRIWYIIILLLFMDHIDIHVSKYKIKQ